MAQLVNVIAPIFTNEKGLFLQTIYYPLQLFATHCHGTALDLLIESSTYKTQGYDAVPYLDASAADTGNGTLVLNVTNRHQEQPLDVVFELTGKRFDGQFEVSEVNGPDIKAENNFDTTTVKTTQGQSVSGNGGTLKYRCAPHSFTQLRGRMS